MPTRRGRRSPRSNETTARKFPKAVAKIVDDADVLLEFYRYPAEHWIHLHTTNPIESTFATVRLRSKITKGPGSRAAGLAMAFKLIEAAETRWRAVNAPAPGRPRSGRSSVREGQTHRTTGRFVNYEGAA
jgi:transposase-like protein